MDVIYLLVLIVFDSVTSLKPLGTNLPKAIYRRKRQSETITPARYSLLNRNIKYGQLDSYTQEPYFPNVQYPTNIMEASKPYYFRTSENNEVFAHFTEDVKANFEALTLMPVVKKLKPIGPGYKQNTKYKKVSESVSNVSSINSTLKATEPTANILQENNKKKHVSDLAVTSTIVEDKDEEVISPDYQDDYEDIEYCTDYCSIENGSEDYYYYDDVEVFDSDDLTSDITRVEDSMPIVLESNTTNLNSSSSNMQESKSIKNTENVISPEISPVDVIPSANKNKTNIIRRAPKKLGMGPVQNTKKNKLLKNFYGIWSKFP